MPGNLAGPEAITPLHLVQLVDALRHCRSPHADTSQMPTNCSVPRWGCIRQGDLLPLIHKTGHNDTSKRYWCDFTFVT